MGEWSVEAAQILPALYADNVCFQSMAVRNRDILRMIDIKSRPEDLGSEVIVDLYGWPAITCLEGIGIGIVCVVTNVVLYGWWLLLRV